MFVGVTERAVAVPMAVRQIGAHQQSLVPQSLFDRTIEQQVMVFRQDQAAPARLR